MAPLFGDQRDQHLVDVLGATIAILRRQMRDERRAELAEHVEPQLRKVAALELKIAELTGAVDVLSGKQPPPDESECLDPQAERIAALELEVAKLSGAIAVLLGKQPPPPAEFPPVKAWEPDVVFHDKDVVTFGGSTYQALKDTARDPTTRDWRCLAAGGRDGQDGGDGKGFTVRGTYDPRAAYAHLDVVAYNGASFTARKSAPGPCPGSDWQLLAKIGKRGERGERGPQGPAGERGEAAPAIRAWEVDRARYVATPIMSDGSRGSPLELHGLFEQFLGNEQWLISLFLKACGTNSCRACTPE